MNILQCDAKTTVTGLSAAVATAMCWIIEQIMGIVIPERIYVAILTITIVLVSIFAADSKPENCDPKAEVK